MASVVAPRFTMTLAGDAKRFRRLYLVPRRLHGGKAVMRNENLFAGSPLSAATLREIALEPGRPRPGPGEVHIVDQLIAERSMGLRSHPLWPLMRPFLYKILHYDAAVKLADTVASLPPGDVFEHASQLLSLDIHAVGEHNIPREGGFVVVANHPTGIADGIAMHDMLSHWRDDIVYMANRDALRVNIRLADALIPVEWRESARTATKTKETLKLTSRAISRGAALVIFPSGRLAAWKDGGLRERPWMASAVTLAKKHGLPIVPMRLTARNSGLFYFVSRFSQELRDMTIFHELLNKKGKRFDFSIAPPIAPAELGEASEATRRLQHFCEHTLASDPSAVFDPEGPLAPKAPNSH